MAHRKGRKEEAECGRGQRVGVRKQRTENRQQRAERRSWGKK
jgi:hypothetical protein